MADPLPTRPLPCPQCRDKGIVGGCRIGNRRNECDSCNAFAQRVLRKTRTRLAEAFADEAAAIRLQVEIEEYRRMLVDWDVRKAQGARA